MSEAWADIGPAVAMQRSEEDEAVLSAQAEKKAALAARPDKRGEAVPVQVNLAEWMRTGFFECRHCLKHWQWVAPTGEMEAGPQVIPLAEMPGCEFCGAAKWKVKWIAPVQI